MNYVSSVIVVIFIFAMSVLTVRQIDESISILARQVKQLKLSIESLKCDVNRVDRRISDLVKIKYKNADC